MNTFTLPLPEGAKEEDAVEFRVLPADDAELTMLAEMTRNFMLKHAGQSGFDMGGGLDNGVRWLLENLPSMITMFGSMPIEESTAMRHVLFRKLQFHSKDTRGQWWNIATPDNPEGRLHMALFERSRLLMYWLMWKAYEAQMRLDDVQFVFSSAIADVAARVQPAEREEPDETLVGLPDESAYEAAD